MKLGGENRPAWLQTRHWKGFAGDISIKHSLVFDILSQMAGEIVPKSEATARNFHATYGSYDIVERILEVIKKTDGKLA